MMEALKLLFCIAVCQLAGLIGALATMRSLSGWYVGINKPSFNPPGWVFAPVWTILYTLMGIAAWLVWRKGLANGTVKVALTLFLIQLVLNSAWTFIFFGARQPLYAFMEIIVLLAVIVCTMVWFFRISTPAGALMVPYVLWVSFASVLNFSIWWLNR